MSKKIETHNLGVNHDGNDQYFIEDDDSRGVYATSSGDNVGSKTLLKMISVDEVFAEVFDRHFEKEKIVIKMDCEGGEYQI